MALNRACVVYEKPTESTHCLNLGTRREEEQRAAEGDMEKNCRLKERGRRWVLPPGAKLTLQETELVGGDKSTALFSQRRHRK